MRLRQENKFTAQFQLKVEGIVRLHVITSHHHLFMNKKNNLSQHEWDSHRHHRHCPHLSRPQITRSLSLSLALIAFPRKPIWLEQLPFPLTSVGAFQLLLSYNHFYETLERKMSKNNIHGTELWHVYRSTLPSAGVAASSSQQPLLERDTILSAIHTHRKTTNENNNSHRMAAIQRSTSDAMRTEEKVACGWSRRSIAEGRTRRKKI